ncbi:MAG: discoidin domain-containing protein [Caldilineaceae bacterium]
MKPRLNLNVMPAPSRAYFARALHWRRWLTVFFAALLVATALGAALAPGSAAAQAPAGAGDPASPPGTGTVYGTVVGPQAISVSPPPDGAYGAGHTLDFTVNFDKPAILANSSYNLALHQPASSPNTTCLLGGSPAATVDGDYHTEWCTPNLHSASLLLTLAQTSVVSQVVVYHDGYLLLGLLENNTVDFSISTSADGVTWHSFDSVTHNSDSVTYHSNADAAPARFVRLDITNGDNSLVLPATRIREVRVFGAQGLAFIVGSTARVANYVSGSGTNQHHFRYTVVAGDNDSDGIAVTEILTGGTTLADVDGHLTTVVTLPPVDTSGVIVDTDPPRIDHVTATPASGIYGPGQQIDVQVVYTEPVTVSGSPQVTLTVGATDRPATYTAGSGTSTLTFRYTLQAGDSDADGIAVKSPIVLNGGLLADAAGNNAQLTFAGFTTAINADTTAPGITSVLAPTGLFPFGAAVDMIVSWGEAVTVGGTPHLLLDVGGKQVNATYLAGSGTSTHTFRYTVGAGELDADGLAVASLVLDGAVLQDQVGNAAVLTLPGLSGVAHIDGVAPSALAVEGPAGTVNPGEDATFVITWTEPVTVTGSPYLTITIGANERQAFYVSGSPGTRLVFSYTLQGAESSPFALTAAVQLNGGSIVDAAGNGARTSLECPFIGNFGVVDPIPPAVEGVVPPADGYYGPGQVLTFTLMWSEAVTATGTPLLPFTIGGAPRSAATAGGANVATLQFTYTIQPGDNAAAGIVLGTNLDMSSGTIRDRGDNDAVTILPATTTTGVVIDTTLPTLLSMSPPAPGLYRAGAELDWVTTWSEPLVTSGTPTATLQMGAAGVGAALVSGSGTLTLTFRYAVQPADNDADGVALLEFATSAMCDHAGNAPAVGGLLPYTSAAIVDNVAPVVLTSAVAPGQYGLNQGVPFTVTWSEPVSVAGAPYFTVTVGTALRHAIYQYGSGSTVLVFRYLVGADDSAQAGSVAVTGTIDLDGGSIRDAAGNEGVLAPLSVTGTGAVVVHVTSPATQPLAVNDAVGLLEAGAADIAVLANDLDPLGSGLTVLAVTQPAYGAATINPDHVTVHYSAPDGLHSMDTFSYIAQNTNGETSMGEVEVVIGALELTDEPPQVDVLDPALQHTEHFTSHHALVEAVFPVRIFTGTLEAQDIFFFSYMATLTPTEHTVMPTGMVQLSDFEFELAAYLDHTLLEDIDFTPPVTLTVTYSAALAADLDPATMRLYYWNGTAWSTEGITFVSYNSADHAMTVTASHLGEFAMFGVMTTDDFLYLPALYVAMCNALTCGASAEPVMVEPAALPAEMPVGLPAAPIWLYLPAVDRH